LATHTLSLHDARPIFDPIFKQMIEQGASDLHMTMGQPICFRVDGSVKRIGTKLLDERSMEQFLMPTMPLDNQREFAQSGDTDYRSEEHTSELQSRENL